MRLTFALILVFLGLVIATENYCERDDILKQKFIYEILHRIGDSLQFDEWIQHGKTLVVEKSLYKKYDRWMDTFYESHQQGGLLPRGEFFGELVYTHMQQAKGLFHFFYFAKDWETFQQNVCWARIHVNEGMFVYALNLAILHREWPLVTPAIYEIFPQHFFNSKLIQEAMKFNSDVWALNEKQLNSYNNTEPIKKWQWWKRIGLAQRWRAGGFELSVSNMISERAFWPFLSEIQKNNTKFFIPVDYTREIKIWNADSEMSYFTEDVEWSDIWYRLNLETSVLLPLECISAQNRSVVWLQQVQKYLARYNLERLSNGLGEIEDLNRSSNLKTGYNPQMVSWNGLPFLQRVNDFDYKKLSSSAAVQQLTVIRGNFLNTLKSCMLSAPYPWRTYEGYKDIAKLLHGVIDEQSENFTDSFLPAVMMFNSQTNYDEFYDVQPHVLLNFETMLRDPLAYVIFKAEFLDYMRQYQNALKPYGDKFVFEGVKIVEVQIGDIYTYFKCVDFDVSNVLNEKMNFVDGQYHSNCLMAMQTRLAHNGFQYNITVDSVSEQQVLVRLFIGPKYDAHGKVLSLNENRWNFVEIDSFEWTLRTGINFEYADFHTFEFFETDRLSYTEKYLKVLLSLREGDCMEKTSRKPRWTLPKGTPEGLPLQIFFIIQNVNADIYTFPFDREIDEIEFFGQNMIFKDVKIYHKDNEEKQSSNYN